MLTAAIALLVTSSPAYRVIDTGVWATSYTASMNDHGVVVGLVGDGEDPDARGFYWKDGKVDLIKSPYGGPVLFTDINNDGVAVGNMYQRTTVADVPFAYTRETGFKLIAEWPAQLTSISETGIIAGTTADEDDRTIIGLWNLENKFTPLYTMGPHELFVEGLDINKAGTVASGVDEMGFRISEGKEPARLSFEPHDATIAYAINNKGWVCGGSVDPRTLESMGPGHSTPKVGSADVWLPDNTRIRIGGYYTQLLDINDDCIAVGTQVAPGTHGDGNSAIVWDRGAGVRDLNTLVPPGSPRLIRAVKINNVGDILCKGRMGMERSHWYLLKRA